MKTAIVHDYLNQFGGAERVLEVFHKIFPQAPIFTLFYDPNALPQYRYWDIRPSFLNKIPFTRQKYRSFMPLFPFLISTFDLRGFDCVITLTHAWGKGIRVPKGARHICFCHTPIRYFWDLYDEYRHSRHLSPVMQAALPLFAGPIRRWDVNTSKSVEGFIAVSHTVADRIKRIYNREAVIINPPVDTSFFVPAESDHGDYFLTVARLKEYKKVDIITEAFNHLGLPLKIIGSGELLESFRKSARSNIEFVGAVSDEELRVYYQRCRAFVFAANEDFGLVALEAQACGRPVIAYGKGGLLETVVEPDTGLFYKEQSAPSLIDAIKKFEKMDFSPDKIRQNALRFDTAVFEKNIRGYFNGALSASKSKSNEGLSFAEK